MAELRRRNTLRHPDYDYTLAGAYFVTICTQQRRPHFGEISDETMNLTPLGRIADQSWRSIAAHHPEIHLDSHVIMPNHTHVLLWFPDDRNAANRDEPRPERRFGVAISGSLSSLVGSYKSAVTQLATRTGLEFDPPLWQRSFHDHIVRDEREMQRIREYIQQNPLRWELDRYHCG